MIEKLIGFVPLPVKLGVVAIAAVGAFAYGFSLGLGWNADDLAECEGFVKEMEAANVRVAEANRIKIEQAEQTTREVANAYVRNSDRIERDLVSRLAGLRREASNCATSALVAASTASPDEAPTKSGASAKSFEATCFEIERNAAGDALQMMWLQHWVQGTCK